MDMQIQKQKGAEKSKIGVNVPQGRSISCVNFKVKS